jgi:hypothetical protein
MATSLQDVAHHVNWYTDPQLLLSDANLFLCQVMARGGVQDLIVVQRHFPLEAFREALLHAPAGLFSKRAWAYWTWMLLNDLSYPMPERFPGANQFDWRHAK